MKSLKMRSNKIKLSLSLFLAIFHSPSLFLSHSFGLMVPGDIILICRLTERLKYWSEFNGTAYYAVRNYQTTLLNPTFFKAKEALCPPLTSVTGNLFRWMLLTERGWKWPRGSGPKRSVSLQVIVPFIVVPDTTVPTPWNGQTNFMVLWSPKMVIKRAWAFTITYTQV